MLNAQKLIAAAMLAAAATPAFAVLTVNDTAVDGSFAIDPITYGNGAGAAYVSPYLYAGGNLGGGASPAAEYVLGAGIDYSYSFTGSGSSQVDLFYHFTNTRAADSLFPNIVDARFFLDVLAAGSSSEL